MMYLMLLLILAPVSVFAAEPGSRRVVAKRGHKVALDAEDFGIEIHPDTRTCKVQVVTSDPASMRVGSVYPENFDCNVPSNSVHYTNNGSPLLNEDTIRFHVYQFKKEAVTMETIIIQVLVVDASHSVFVDDARLRSLEITEQYGRSDLLDTSVLQFNYNYYNGASCVVSYSKYTSNLPLAGDIMDRHGVEVRTMQKDCRELLVMGLWYRHRHAGSPLLDYFPLTVEVEDPIEKGQVIQESMYLPIQISGSQPNHRPNIRLGDVESLEVEQYTLLTIDPRIISAIDDETPADFLVFNISRQPEEGFFVHLLDQTQKLYSFKQSDLLQHGVAYHPPSGSIGRGKTVEFELTAFDSYFASSPPTVIQIKVKPSKSLAPRVATNKGLTVAEGGSTPITEDNLAVVDADNRDRVEIHLKGGPRHGRLVVDGLPVIVFTPKDLKRGNVVYVHDDSDTTEDKLILRITDGDFTVRTKFSIRILPKDDSSPSLITNKGVEVMEGGYAKLSNNRMSAHDKDTLDDYIRYVIRTPPSFGEIIKRHHPDTSGHTVSEFTQLDVDRGYIYYHHLGGLDTTDTFEFRLMDRQEPPNKSGKYRFDVTIKKSGNNLPPSQVEGTKRQIEVRETDIAFLGKEHLWYEDPEHLEEGKQLTYTITSLPFYVSTSITIDAGRLISTENLTLVVKDRNIPPVYTFTQNDVDEARIAYMPPMEDIGPIRRQAQFVYTVSDREGNQVMGERFDITLIPVNNQVPHMVINPISVKEGETVRITTKHISAYDPDTEQDKLVFTLEKEPRFGQLLKDDIKLIEGEEFTLVELSASNIRYEHFGAESSSDSFGLSVSDTNHKFSTVIPIEVKLHVNQGPQALPDLQTSMTVPEGGSVQITKVNIGASDNDTDDETLLYMLIKSPTMGEIRLNNRLVTDFSQKDLWEQKLMYVHTQGEIGQNPRTDMITFMVADQTFPPPPGAKPLIDLKMTIEPVDNKAPQIDLGGPMFVYEGQRSPLMLEVLTASDVDSSSDKISFVVTGTPKWGSLQNIRDSATSEQEISAFTLDDIKDRVIVYVQRNHSDQKPIVDSFEVYATDGQQNSNRGVVEVSIVPENDQLPKFEVPDIIVQEGGEAAFEVEIVDDKGLGEDIEELTLSLGREPHHGWLVLVMDAMSDTKEMMEIPLQEVTLGDLDMGMQIVYKHDGSDTLEDQFMLRLSDGYHMSREFANVKIQPVNDEKPQVLNNAILQVDFGGNGIISKQYLEVIDEDTSANDLTFTITSEPRKGIIQYQEKDGQWTDITKGVNFTQTNINNNQIRYLHTKALNDFPIDDFVLELTDGVNIVSLDFAVEVVTREHNKVAVLNRGLTISEGGSEILSPDMLTAMDGNNKPQDLVFVITSPPNHGSLSMVTNKQAHISSFSQLDIQSSKVVYIHNGQPNTPHDSFHFTVVNGLNQSNGGIFQIKVEVIDKAMPSLDVNVPLTVVQGDRVSLTKANLLINDPDTPSTNLTYIITEPPQHGKLLKKGLIITDTFTQFDIDQGMMEYKSDSTDDSGVDYFLFAISDSNHKGYLTNGTLERRPAFFNILIQPISKEPPRIVTNKAPEKVELLGNGKIGFYITGQHLKSVHPLSESRDIIYTLKNKPVNGYLEHLGTRRPVRRKFTQRDLDDKRIAYILEEPTDQFNDSFSFRVHDLNRNTLDDQIFHLEWSLIQFDHSQYIVCEDAGTLAITISRKGALNTTSSVEIRAKEMSAKEVQDFMPSPIAIIEFKPGETQSVWELGINLDHIYEENEKLKVLLRNPLNAVLSDIDKTVVQIVNYDQGMCASYIGIITKSDNRHRKTDNDDLGYDVMDESWEQRPSSGRHHGNTEKYPARQSNEDYYGPRTETKPSSGLLETDLSYYTGHQSTEDEEEDIWGWNDSDYNKKSSKKNGKDSKKNRRKKRRRNKDGRSSQEEIENMSPTSDNFVAKDASPEVNANVRQPCTRDTQGLLYFDLLSSKMYRCSGKNWEQWGWGANYLQTAVMQEDQGAAQEDEEEEDEDGEQGGTRCESGWVRYRDNCHKFMTDKTTWTVAEHTCVEAGGHLTDIMSNKHMEFLWKLSSQQSFWIGLNSKRRAEEWEWSNGAPLRFTHWRKRHPKPQRVFPKPCVYVSRKGEWVNRPCDTVTAKYICTQPAKTRRKRHHQRAE